MNHTCVQDIGTKFSIGLSCFLISKYKDNLNIYHVWVVCLITQLCTTLWTPWTVAHQAPMSMEILQARIQGWVAMPSSRGSSQPKDRTQVSHIAGSFFTVWVTREAHVSYGHWLNKTWHVYALEYYIVIKLHILTSKGSSQLKIQLKWPVE